MRIAIDLMGGDTAPELLFEAVLAASYQLKRGRSLVVLAPYALIEAFSPAPSSIRFYPVEEWISMEDDPLWAIRKKKQSSQQVGLRLVRDKEVDALVSVGNTGSLVGGASLTLPLIHRGVRPALLATLPARQGSLVVLDVGGNISCQLHHLVQFARFGSAYSRFYLKVKKPRVALLNIGKEAKKGTSLLKDVYHYLVEHPLPHAQFIGNLEACDVFEGEADVLITEGFSGNVLLKTAEGISSFMLKSLEEVLQQENSSTIKGKLQQLHTLFDHHESPGALVVGVQGVVIKCHGNSPAQALYQGILGAMQYVREDIVSILTRALI